MKTRILAIILTTFIVFVSCKNEKKNETQSEIQKEEVLNDSYKVTLEVTVKKDDDFQIYYTDKTSGDFSEQESIWVKVKGSESSQKVVFTFPENALPTLFRLDFGLNIEQEDIVLTSIEVNYFEKRFITIGREMAVYFRQVDDTQIDFETGIIKTIIKDGKRIEPILYPHEVPLEKELKKLLL